MTSSTRSNRAHFLRLTAIGVAATGLCVAGAGLAAAASPQWGFARAVEDAAQVVGIDWSAMPENYTREQYEAYWAAEYSAEDLEALQEMWSVDETEAKARAGQMLIDGEALPFAPGTHASPTVTADDEAEIAAFFAAGYDADDVAELGALWSTDALETKARAGQLLLDGQTLPVEGPGATPAG
ncbi:hypothetical protein [Cellulomonas fimi]|uniref:Uncharacterized protein n=1 Tax=Cellulomonas fimi (strain ATCC 484 / DSM 20113 / JCM 1341 / CCUG 24087 / LMG 16345 / NBRC 15513 / NCIMB 8980 / NCTC 7547 / NRS-133) TaxID=590998 RepID=F4H351_CELFA|nr:hypothetical protein [Cellulomonas fimi]AEE47669.1 hypothetical protein Celf_3559 [Cellulomonas fimi ATCC 484]NNH07425.1 hypothetical protein [Cellulomonas fimi]VEH36761.1 Uncharacterised protein [Cellulomonas fimi]